MTDAATAADDDLDPADREALGALFALMLADRELGGLVADKLARAGSRSTSARFAAFALQSDALALKPWQHPPAWGGIADADGLADRLRRAGLRGTSRTRRRLWRAKERPKRR